jgi:hypothetical protein
MGEATALKLAIDLLHVPSRVRPMRSAPLPLDVLTLLEIAAGDADATRRASEASGRTQEVVRNAAAFFIEQMLLAPGADSYRVLGGNAQASSSDLRRNMALLLRWLHPDMEHNGNGDRSVFAARITLAWENLKTAERRAAYDAQQQGGAANGPAGRGKSGARRRTASKQVWPGPHAARHGRADRPQGGLWRALLMLFGVARH